MALSELQIALLGAGAAAVAAVWGYNVWQDRKYKHSAEELFKGTQADVLLKHKPGQPAPESDERREPSVHPVGVVDAEDAMPVAAAGQVPEPDPSPLPEVRDAPPQNSPAVMAGAGEFEIPAPADALSDCIVRFALAEPVSPDRLLAAGRTWSDAISKPIAWLACDAADNWHRVGAADAGSHARWLLALQLVDRRGAASQAEIKAFIEGVEALVRQFGGDVALPDGDEVLQQAEALDAFCAGVDIQFGINVVDAKGGAFAATKLRGICEAAGLSLRDDGRFHAVDDAGGDSFWISDIGGAAIEADATRAAPIHGITFTLDVPRVANGAREFDRMLALAQQSARALDGVLVDAQRQPLAAAMTGVIRAKIVELQQRMQEAEIPAGGMRAGKLFA